MVILKGNWELELERTLLKCTLEKTIKKSNVVLNPIFLPEKPEDNWTYKGSELKPIYLPYNK